MIRLLASALLVAMGTLTMVGCVPSEDVSAESDGSVQSVRAIPEEGDQETAMTGERYRGFALDQTLEGESGTIHYHILVPEDLDQTQPVSLFITLPGYQGLYFQGVGRNIETEDFGFTAADYRDNLVVVAPQLNGWGETSALQTIELTEAVASQFDVSPENTFLEGYSGGGETLSLVLGLRPDLYGRALACSTQWDGDLEALANAETPVYMAIGKDDEYYGSEPLADAAEELDSLYRAKGLADDEIDRLVILDVKDDGYFEAGGISNQHGGGAALFAHDDAIMGWLLGGQI